MREALMEQWTRILKVFLEKESAYRKHSGAMIAGREERFEWTEPRTQTRVRGVVDRYDVLPEPGGLVVMDYKTGGEHPSGQTMIQRGYRLQLGVTALAFQERMQRTLVAACFVKLDRTGHRTRGIFFEPWVDKKWISHATTRKQNVFSEEARESVLNQLHDALEIQLRQRSQGIFDARPKVESECANCGSRELCLESRRENLSRKG